MIKASFGKLKLVTQAHHTSLSSRARPSFIYPYRLGSFPILPAHQTHHPNRHPFPPAIHLTLDRRSFFGRRKPIPSLKMDHSWFSFSLYHLSRPFPTCLFLFPFLYLVEVSYQTTERINFQPMLPGSSVRNLRLALGSRFPVALLPFRARLTTMMLRLISSYSCS